MTIPSGTRELVRQRAGYRCEFCGSHEIDAGGELTIDHYRPRAREGDDGPDNLIYACSRCNLYKHDFWPESPEGPRLWNPRDEPFENHFIELPDGTLDSLTPTGAFTIRQLRLNRPQLVARRQRNWGATEAQKQLELYRGIVAVAGQLLSESSTLASAQSELLQDLRGLLARLLGSGR